MGKSPKKVMGVLPAGMNGVIGGGRSKYRGWIWGRK